MIIDWALDFALACVVLAMALCGWRGLRGPDLPDRILALDTLAINAIAGLLLLGIRWQTAGWFEAALIAAEGGHASITGQLWDDAGRLVAVSSQLVAEFSKG